MPFGNKLHWFESQCQHIIFSFWICFILTSTQLNYAVTHPLFNYMFQKLSLLHRQGYKCEWRKYFCFFSVISFFFLTDILIYRVRVRMRLKLGMWISLLLAGCSRSRDLTLGCMIWNICRKELLSVWCVCWGCLDRGWFHSHLVTGWGVGSEVLLEQVQLNFSFRNKFIILLPWGLLVDNNIFLKVCVFKSLPGYTDYGG
jgi:hypothetical protein